MAHGDIRKALGLCVGQNLHKHRTYRIWKAMRQRCYRLNHHAKERYASRGILVCDRWMDFLLFLDDMGNPPSEKHSIDRINNDLGYSKENCKWSTPKEQSSNRRNAVMITTPVGILSLTEAASHYGLRVDTVWKRINILKWPESDWFIKNQKKGTRHA